MLPPLSRQLFEFTIPKRYEHFFQRLMPFTLVLGLMSLCGASAQAAFIPITNPSFESPFLGDGASSGFVPGWAGIFGAFNPAVTQTVGGLVPDGRNVAANNGSIFFQTLTTNLASSTQYTLSLFVGRRLENQVGFPGYLVELLAGSTVLTQNSGIVTPGPGLFLPISISYTSGVNDPLAGQALRIQLRSLGIQTLFDDVRLEATPLVNPNPVPEPSTLALAGVAALGLMRVRRAGQSRREAAPTNP